MLSPEVVRSLEALELELDAVLEEGVTQEELEAIALAFECDGFLELEEMLDASLAGRVG